jgi:hypothetical protein
MDGPTTLYILFQAICLVESGNNPAAYNPRENAVGPCQIRPAALADYNHLKSLLYPDWDPIRLKDCASYTLSEDIFIQYTEVYLAKNQQTHPGMSLLEIRARIWNGGPRGPSKPATLPYWHRVRAAIQTLKAPSPKE